MYHLYLDMFFFAVTGATEIYLSEKPSKAKQPHPTWQLKVFFPVGAQNLTSMLQQDSKTSFETAVKLHLTQILFRGCGTVLCGASSYQEMTPASSLDCKHPWQ